MAPATLVPMEFLKKSADPLLIESSYRELALPEPMTQPGYHMKLVLDGPRRITLSNEVLGKGIGIGGQWPVETGRKRMYHELSPCDVWPRGQCKQTTDYAEYIGSVIAGQIPN